MQRILFTLKKLFVYRKGLRAILLRSSQDKAASALKLNVKILDARKIKALVLDFDGVLAPHGAMQIIPSFAIWLANLQKDCPQAIFILSNNAYAERDTYFKTHFPDIKFIKGMPRKPYPQGLLHIAQLTRKEPHEILMVDDRLLTGILAGLVAGTQTLWITQPVRDLKLNFFQEVWFGFLRWIDKLLILIMV